jgi:RNA polymerase sigma factor (sigma-70 family)
MNRILSRICEQIADGPGVTDRHLLERFLTARDEAAFAELVRRYGPVVWGACRRRLANFQDAEDAFQATFLVLVRHAHRLSGDVSLGPWLYTVAALTTRNVLRGNRRRSAIAGPMEHEAPTPDGEPSAECLDLDAALLALPERDRRAVVLCHLQGLTRREAAERLGCPEGTLSARLNRALRRLRTRLGGDAAALFVAAVAVPTGLATATVRSAVIYSTSTLAAAGVSPVVVGLTDGVLRMFWMKKVMTAAVAVVLVLGAGVLALGTADRSGNVAHATEPPTTGAPPAPAEEPDALKRIEREQAVLEKQKALAEAALEDLKVRKQKLQEAQKAKSAAAELGSDLAIVVTESGGKLSYTVREVVNEKIGEMHCSDSDVLAKYLARTFNDPKGPKKLRVHASKGAPEDQLKKLFEACAAAGYSKVTFIEKAIVAAVHSTPVTTYKTIPYSVQKIETREIDLTKYASPNKP